MLLVSYLKSSEVKNNDVVKFMNEGQWVEQNFQGKVSKSLQFIVEYKGEEKILKLNKLSKDNLKVKWGSDTAKWPGNEALVAVVPALIGGKMIDTIILTPKE